MAGGNIDIIILAGVDDVEAGDPSEDCAAEDECWQQVGRMDEDDFAADRDPCGDRRKTQATVPSQKWASDVNRFVKL